MKGEPIYIYGDGETTRDFCYIESAIEANILAATTSNSNALNTAYSVAVGERTTLNALYNDLEAILKRTNCEPTYKDFRAVDIRILWLI